MRFLAVNNFGDTVDGGMAGPMGLFVIVVLVIATVLLIRNMNRRLRRLPDSFAAQQRTQREADVARMDAAATAPESATALPDVDPSRSATVPAGKDYEVTAVATEGDGPSAGSDPGRV